MAENPECSLLGLDITREAVRISEQRISFHFPKAHRGHKFYVARYNNRPKKEGGWWIRVGERKWARGRLRKGRLRARKIIKMSWRPARVMARSCHSGVSGASDGFAGELPVRAIPVTARVNEL